MSTRLKVSADKNVRAEARVLERLGFQYDRHTGNHHPVYTHPVHGEIELASASPGHRRNLARVMGTTVAELEARLAGQEKVGKRRRKPKGRERSRHLTVAPEALTAPPVVREPQAVKAQPMPPEAVLERELARTAACLPSDPIGSRNKAWKQIEKATLGLNARERLENPFPWRRAA